MTLQSITMSTQYLHEIFEHPLLPVYSKPPVFTGSLPQPEVALRSISNSAGNLIGQSRAMMRVCQLMTKVACSDSTVLIMGETGTGKELVASGIHAASHRRNKTMVKVNCGALPPSLIESELFGHERGSFTGATDKRIGKFELAHNSTLFLDEIGEMPMDMQVKLLRVIQERELERIGGQTTIKVNVRIIVATNRNLEEEVKAGRFRADLYYRLNVFPIQLPALRERPDDIALLAAAFLAKHTARAGKKITTISHAVMLQLHTYWWPGNVRELEHVIERSVLLEQGGALREVYLPQAQNIEVAVPQKRPAHTLQEMERSYIIEILKRYNGRISGSRGASAFLAIPPSTLHSKMKKLGISKFDYYERAI